MENESATNPAAAPVGATVNNDGQAENGRAHMSLHLSEDGRYRWFGDDGSDTEISGRTIDEAISLAESAWSGIEWGFELDAAPVGNGDPDGNR
jgi:hypothetical protein